MRISSREIAAMSNQELAHYIELSWGTAFINDAAFTECKKRGLCVGPDGDVYNGYPAKEAPKFEDIMQVKKGKE